MTNQFISRMIILSAWTQRVFLEKCMAFYYTAYVAVNTSPNNKSLTVPLSKKKLSDMSLVSIAEFESDKRFEMCSFQTIKECDILEIQYTLYIMK